MINIILAGFFLLCQGQPNRHLMCKLCQEGNISIMFFKSLIFTHLVRVFEVSVSNSVCFITDNDPYGIVEH